MPKQRLLQLFSCFLIALLIVNCQRSTTPPATLTVSAAASLKDALEQIQPLYEQQQPVKLTYNFGSSGALQQQIEQGAPADVFISAAPKQMDALQQKGELINETRRDLLRNQIVLIVPRTTTGVASFQDLASDRVRRVGLGEPKSVPAGTYAQEVLTALKLLDAVKPKAVYAKDVRQVLNFVESQNADAGIVYRSDALSSDQVKIVATAPETSHSPVIYPIAVLKRTPNRDAAQKFVQFLSSDAAKAVFGKQGFSVSSATQSTSA
ncbi:molybdate ABC transporter substrate-binding protein [Leptolyngbya sp. NIES-2104]|uniref:molybdate ABC transporter substrate-binding protein n=1 Tax=Leptolyngbya sp. NIES-2104 TaxID=1552121 RepID=UPI0006EC9383|nr:molybdate ABC transporter substrate-binding protein [Leptolyngbya sp. NIES-2104]GAP99409.1 molybdenum ABC transporter, periplasmic molybdenum-binding protein ModA [Leptolyngbya sp. NIES-2104]